MYNIEQKTSDKGVERNYEFENAIDENAPLSSVVHAFVLLSEGHRQWRCQPKNWGGKMRDFRRITLFCLEKRFSKHKMTIFSKTFFVGHGPFRSPWLRLWSQVVCGANYGCLRRSPHALLSQ